MPSTIWVLGLSSAVREITASIPEATSPVLSSRRSSSGALGLEPGTGDNNFSDVKAEKWYCDYIKTASAYGIITGYDADTFGPNDTISREQAMTMIARAMEITGLKAGLADSEISNLLAGYSDSSSSAGYAKESIREVSENRRHIRHRKQ